MVAEALVQPRGSVNPISVLLLIALAGAVYWAVIFGPLYFDNMQIGEALDVGIHTPGGEADVAKAVLARINFGPEAVGTHLEEDANGNPVEKRGLNLTEENVTVERDNGRTHISVDYTREVRLFPTQTMRAVTLHKEKEGSFQQ